MSIAPSFADDVSSPLPPRRLRDHQLRRARRHRGARRDLGVHTGTGTQRPRSERRRRGGCGRHRWSARSQVAVGDRIFRRRADCRSALQPRRSELVRRTDWRCRHWCVDAAPPARAPVPPSPPSERELEQDIARRFDDLGARLAAGIQDSVLRSLEGKAGEVASGSAVDDIAARMESLGADIDARVQAALAKKGIPPSP